MLIAVSRAVLLVLVLIVAINIFLTASQALDLEHREVAKIAMGAKGYVSDEVWYVDAARNILRKVFGLVPRMDTPRATLVYPDKDLVKEASKQASNYGVKVVSDLYTEIPAIYVEAKSIERFARATNASDIVFGWMLSDAERVNEYLNLEHPPRLSTSSR